MPDWEWQFLGGIEEPLAPSMSSLLVERAGINTLAGGSLTREPHVRPSIEEVWYANRDLSVPAASP